jgi:hypothetical protein
MEKIIIEVRGGLVDAVYSNKSNITVKILDWDNIDIEDMSAEEKQMLKEIKTMKDIL